jgi:transglutaminase-like putative cysteine protease
VLDTVAAETGRGLLLEETLVYAYDRPIRDLRHRLVVVPRAAHGSQLRRDYGVRVSERAAEVVIGVDAFSNCVVNIAIGAVTRKVEFTIWALVASDPVQAAVEPTMLQSDRRFLRATALTEPSPILIEVGRELAREDPDPLTIGASACAWVHRVMRYEFGVTGVGTTAVKALAGGKGVCQDYAHIMLAVCRAAGIPARYVSGHLVGEGGSHAWVEVLVPGPFGGGTIAVGFDPTHDRRVDARYLTVAVGRDYEDVAPTSGTFRGRAASELRVEKRLSAISDEVG